ncbi:hypothetical protein [Vibrio hibernica]|uniref:hypothetical protein n=1 Tax=Vibrio hibernica TaxID=2587465 RepID=UPI001880BA07|nr:hypothetical protein [Vibrio hibernica]
MTYIITFPVLYQHVKTKELEIYHVTYSCLYLFFHFSHLLEKPCWGTIQDIYFDEEYCDENFQLKEKFRLFFENCQREFYELDMDEDVDNEDNEFNDHLLSSILGIHSSDRN